MSMFVSYSRVDSDFVDLLHERLTRKGYDVWVDRQRIGVGQIWDQQVENAIKSCQHMIVVLSDEAVISPNVADEWSYGMDKNKNIIPLLYGAKDVPMRLHRFQHIDFGKLRISDALEQLYQALGKPDKHPSDPIELAKRDGIVLIDLGNRTGSSPIRIAFVYSDYPYIGQFLRTIWFTLLWRDFKYSRDAIYGTKWVLKNKLTNETFQLPDCENPMDALISELGIEPGTKLEIELL